MIRTESNGFVGIFELFKARDYIKIIHAESINFDDINLIQGLKESNEIPIRVTERKRTHTDLYHATEACIDATCYLNPREIIQKDYSLTTQEYTKSTDTFSLFNELKKHYNSLSNSGQTRNTIHTIYTTTR